MKFKKYLFAVLFLSVFLVSQNLISCKKLTDEPQNVNPQNSSSENNEDPLSDFSKDKDLSNSKFMYTLDSNSSITLENLKQGQIILYANFNKGTSTILQENVRAKLSSSSNLNTSSTKVVPFSQSSNSLLNNFNLRFASNASNNQNQQVPKIKHFVPKVSNSKLLENARKNSFRSVSSRAAVKSEPVKISDFKVGTSTDASKRDIFIDVDENLSKYEKRESYLRAIGYHKDGKGYSDADPDKPQDATPICLVWVPNDFWDVSNSKGDKINSTVAHSLAKKFATYCPLEREIFGEESDYLLDSQGNFLEQTMDRISETGNFINIVVYDIGDDYNKEDVEPCGVVGYFYSKDYFETGKYSGDDEILNYTNMGKYFYIDSPYCNLVSTANYYDGDEKLYGGTGDVSGTAITTLFHEFQHMINWNTKTYQDLEPSAWYDETLSMLAEDVLATYLGIENSDDAVWNTRIPNYNEYYFYSALDEYRNDEYAVYSYGTGYALGSYVARNYGGISLIKEISQNKAVDMNSIVQAIKKVKNEDVSALQLYKEVIAASVFRDGIQKNSKKYDFATNNSLPSFYKEVSETIGGNSYTLKPISAFCDDYAYPYDDYGIGDYYSGPKLLANGLVLPEKEGLAGHRFNLHFAGEVSSNGNVTLNFTSSSGNVDSNEQILVFVQDAFSNVVSD